MPTITLQHVTKRFDPGQKNQPALETTGRAVAKGFRAALDPETSRYLDQTQAFVEPADRANALDDLSLTVRDGETLCVLGPSGCGKTTLLKIIAGLIKPDEGHVLYDNRPISDIPLAERGIGMVFQTYALYPHLEARENIGFFDRIRGQPEKIPERIHHIVKIMGVELEHLLSRKPPTLSGGEQQRVAVARCLARDPQLFLFDEPLSNLDAKLRVETRVQIKRLLMHYKITSVYVTHDQIEAIALADRIAIMRAGKIEQIGTYELLYNTPVNAFVAQFFGTPPMNLFSGRAFDTTWRSRSFSISPIRPGLIDGQRAWLGIRPEHIQITETGIAARIEHVEPIHTQRRQLLYARIDDQSCVITVPIEPTFKANKTIQVGFPTEHLYLFDEKTGVRIG